MKSKTFQKTQHSVKDTLVKLTRVVLGIKKENAEQLLFRLFEDNDRRVLIGEQALIRGTDPEFLGTMYQRYRASFSHGQTNVTRYLTHFINTYNAVDNFNRRYENGATVTILAPDFMDALAVLTRFNQDWDGQVEINDTNPANRSLDLVSQINGMSARLRFQSTDAFRLSQLASVAGDNIRPLVDEASDIIYRHSDWETACLAAEDLDARKYRPKKLARLLNFAGLNEAKRTELNNRTLRAQAELNHRAEEGLQTFDQEKRLARANEAKQPPRNRELLVSEALENYSSEEIIDNFCQHCDIVIPEVEQENVRPYAVVDPGPKKPQKLKFKYKMKLQENGHTEDYFPGHEAYTYNLIRDYARLTVLVPDFTHAPAVLKKLIQELGGEIHWHTRREYKAFHLFTQIKGPDNKGVNCEIQIHTPQTRILKEATHDFYDKWNARELKDPHVRQTEEYRHEYDLMAPMCDVVYQRSKFDEVLGTVKRLAHEYNSALPFMNQNSGEHLAPDAEIAQDVLKSVTVRCLQDLNREQGATK